MENRGRRCGRWEANECGTRRKLPCVIVSGIIKFGANACECRVTAGNRAARGRGRSKRSTIPRNTAAKPMIPRCFALTLRIALQRGKITETVVTIKFGRARLGIQGNGYAGVSLFFPAVYSARVCDVNCAFFLDNCLFDNAYVLQCRGTINKYSRNIQKSFSTLFSALLTY